MASGCRHSDCLFCNLKNLEVLLLRLCDGLRIVDVNKGGEMTSPGRLVANLNSANGNNEVVIYEVECNTRLI